MSFEDKTLQCADCSQEFTFTAGEQEFYASRDLHNEPRRCPECRRAKKSQHYGNSEYGSRAPRQMFPVTCADCGKDTEVPFEPRGDKPVYCRDCYDKNKVSR